MEMEAYALKRIGLVVGSVVVVYLVNLFAPGIVKPIADAAVGFGLGIVVRHYWS